MQSLVLEQKRVLSLTWIGGVVFFCALTALASSARIYLPFSPVPITLQTMAVALGGVFLGAWGGISSQLLLIALSGLGFQVFSGTQTGWASLVGPTGGYVLGFMLYAFVLGALRDRGALKGMTRSFILILASSLFVLVPGVLWLKVSQSMTWSVALSAGFVPFLIGDVIKSFLAASVFVSFQKNH